MRTQSGRSMIEMLGVLAIVGVLSVGAFAGYSMAMEKYKSNQAVDEIMTIIREMKELGNNVSNREGVLQGYGATTILQSMEIIPDDSKNVLGYNISVVGFTNYFVVRYSIPQKSLCKNIMLSGWYNELRESLYAIYTDSGATCCGAEGPDDFDPGEYVFSNAAITSPDYPLPVTIENMAVACSYFYEDSNIHVYINY